MHSLMIGANYRKAQVNGAVAIGSGGALGANETAFPALDPTVGPDDLDGMCEKVFIQALSANTDSIWIGPAGKVNPATGAGCIYEIPQGSSLFLPTHVLEKYVMKAGSAGQKALITYFKGVF